jgi:hypothetical protein
MPASGLAKLALALAARVSEAKATAAVVRRMEPSKFMVPPEHRAFFAIDTRLVNKRLPQQTVH